MSLRTNGSKVLKRGKKTDFRLNIIADGEGRVN